MLKPLHEGAQIEGSPDSGSPAGTTAQQPPAAARDAPELKENEFLAAGIQPGQMKKLIVDEEEVAVYNVRGTFFATSDQCTHRGGSLSEGDLDGNVVTCPLHGSQFDVTTGKVVRPPATKPLPLYKITVENGVGRVEMSA